MKVQALNPFFRRFGCTSAYIILIILINNIFVYAPYIMVRGSLISSGDIVVGVVYILRDFVQREIQHYVILAMLVGCVCSYWLAQKEIAVASLAAFTIGEMIDWGIFTYTRKPLSQRLLWSAGISAPIDSVVFLYMTGMLNGAGLVALVLGKFIGILGLWYLWKLKSVPALVARM
jgi:uncharacterized PurR-regulated membrane protein YhhQ (DUF165 family)